jgi:hypothetical protein
MNPIRPSGSWDRSYFRNQCRQTLHFACASRLSRPFQKQLQRCASTLQNDGPHGWQSNSTDKLPDKETVKSQPSSVVLPCHPWG